MAVRGEIAMGIGSCFDQHTAQEPVEGKLFVCLFVCIEVNPVNNFSVMSGQSHRFLNFNQNSGELLRLAQGHNAPVGVEHRTFRS